MKKLGKDVFIREFRLTGKRLKIGFDTNVLVFICEEPKCKQYFDEKINSLRKNADFYIYEHCKAEFINVLVRDYNYSREEASKIIENLIKDYCFNIINITDSHIEKAEHIFFLCKDLGLNKPDNLIIAGYKECGIDIAYSNDEAFVKSCRNLGIDGRKFPNVSSLIAKEMKRLFKGKF